MPVTFILAQWSIVPGPPSIQPPFLSTDLTTIVEYPPELVAEATLGISDVHLLHPAQPDWWSWVARWSTGDGYMDLQMRLFDAVPFNWGGFNLSGEAPPHAVLNFYAQLHVALPATWLHNGDCELHTAASFAATVRAA